MCAAPFSAVSALSFTEFISLPNSRVRATASNVARLVAKQRDLLRRSTYEPGARVFAYEQTKPYPSAFASLAYAEPAPLQHQNLDRRSARGIALPSGPPRLPPGRNAPLTEDIGKCTDTI